MKKFLKMFGAVGLLAGMMMAAGCGDDAAPAVSTKAAQVITGATVANATVTIPAAGATALAPVTVATTPSGVAVLKVVSPNTTFTGVKADGTAITTVPTISVSVPTSGVSGVKQPVSGSAAGFTVESAAGAVDISFDGLNSATFGTPVVVSIPVTGLTAGATANILSVKANGKTSVLTGTVNAGATAVDVNVTDFCWFVVNPVLKVVSVQGKTTGATGSISTFNIQ